MRTPRHKGMALVIVLWFIVLLSVLALGFSRSVRTETRITHNLVEGARARYLAEAAVQKGIFELLSSEDENFEFLLFGASNPFQYGAQQLEYAIQDERGKVDINQVTDEILLNLLTVLDVDSAVAAEITDAVADWSDENELRRLNGAELGEYEEAGLEVIPTNAPYINIAELQQVLGIDAELYRKLVPHITVYAFDEIINPQFARREVLLALPGASESLVEKIVISRDNFLRGDEDAPVPTTDDLATGAPSEIGPIFTVRGTAMLPSRAHSIQELTVWITDGSQDMPFYVLDSRIVEPVTTKEAEE